MIIEYFIIVALASIIRLAPICIMSGSVGVDQWSWRALIDELRRNKKFPPELPCFILDSKQWYPPLFLLLMAKLPFIVYDRFSSIFAVLIDICRLGLLMWFLDGQDLRISGLVAGFVYAFTPILVTYNQQINPRGLAALFFDMVVLAALGIHYSSIGNVGFLFLGILLPLVLLTHKMTTQLMFFAVVVLSIVYKNIMYLLVLPISVVLALLISGGYYWNVIKAHCDIVSFWYANWRWSGANPILESPVYGETDYETPTKFYRRGLYAAFRRLVYVFGFNPWVSISIFLFAYVWFNGVAVVDLEVSVFFWVLIIFSFSLITTIVPVFRCLGQGYLYSYNASFPAAALIGLLATNLSNELYFQSALLFGLFLCFIALFVFFKKVLKSNTARFDASLEECIEYLKTLPAGLVMCLPQHWHDVVAYKTGMPVLWGGHGYGFSLIAPIFPRLLLDIKTLQKKYSVSYLLTYEGYCNDRFISDLPECSVICIGSYRIYRF